MNDSGLPARETPARRSARLILTVSAFLLPTLSLIPLGGFYLWEKGWMLWWAIGAFIAVVIAMLLQRALLNQVTQPVVQDASPTSSPADAASNDQTRLERLAWTDVRAIANSVDVERLNTADAIIALGQTTVDAVARRLHPEKPDAVWRFTLPQALAIAERVSARLGEFVDTRIPFGDRLTVAQLLSVYGWRRYIGVAEQAYDVWRVIRMANPATAVTQEARERLSRSLMNWGKEQVSRRIAEAFVEEVGRAAIDLYGGRLPTGGGRDADDQADTTAGDHAELTLPSIVVVGAETAMRSALAADLEAALSEGGLSESGPSSGAPANGEVSRAKVTNADAIHALGFARRQLTRVVAAADVVVWTVCAERGPSEGDERAIVELRRHFASTQVLPPAMIVAAVSAPTDAATELASYVGGLAHGLAHPDRVTDVTGNSIVAVAAAGHGRGADIRQLAEALSREIAATRAATRSARSAALRRAAGRRGLWASAGQAASAVGGLAGALLKPRAGDRER